MKNLSIIAVVAVVIIFVYLYFSKKNKTIGKAVKMPAFPLNEPNVDIQLADTMDARPDGMTSPSTTVNDRLSADTPTLSLRPSTIAEVITLQPDRGVSTPASITPAASSGKLGENQLSTGRIATLL